MVQNPDSIGGAHRRTSIDLATVIGLICAFVLIGAAIVLGGSPSSFFDVPSVLIVVGGTLAVTTVCFTPLEMSRTMRVLLKTVFHSARDPSDAALHVLRIAEMARRRGVMALQESLPAFEHDAFLHKGISLIVDGTPSEEIEAMLRRDMHATVQRHQSSAGVLRKAAEFAPAMGLIGTLIGLVQMLGNLDDPSSIGPSMAVALITTFYGAVLANMVFSPLAAKLDRNSAEEALVNSLYLMGAGSVSRQENPRRLEMMLNSVLPPARRVRYFD